MDISENITLFQAISELEAGSDAIEAILNSANYTGNSTEDSNGTHIVEFYTEYDSTMASVATLLCTNLGVLSVILNLFVIIALLRNHRRVLLNVFYVIVLHCAILDVVRGLCLIIYGLPSLAQTIYRAMQWQLHIHTNVALFRASSFALILLRICNLLTIFNLLVFTMNEFVVIRYPLHYRRYIRRRTVLAILGICWIVSVAIGLGLLFPQPRPRYMRQDDSTWHIDFATISMLMISILCVVVLAVVVVCYFVILRTIRRFKEESIVGDECHKHNRSIHRTINGTQSGSSNNGSKTKKFKLQAVQRHKYIYVIGTVLIVDLLFLCPYSGLQVVSFLHINGFLEITHSSTFLRWWLQVLIGVHSVCQPLCYFRMTEFRRLACCGARRQWNRTKSLSQMNKSYANTRSAAREEEDLNGGNGSEPLLPTGDNRNTTLESATSTPKHNNWARGESIRFRTYGSDFAQSVAPESVEMKKMECSSAENPV